MKLKNVWALLKDAFSEWSEDKVPRLAAALSYYTIFSIAPLLILVIGIASLIYDPQVVQAYLLGQIGDLISPEGAETIEGMLTGALSEDAGLVATIVGLVTLLIGATGVFGQLQDALNTIWEVAPKPGQGILGVLKGRFLSFSIVLVIGFLLLVSLVITAALSAVAAFTEGLFPGFELVMQVVNFVLSFAVITVLFAMIFKVLPDVKINWRDVWLGAAVTALLFSVGKLLIGLYLGRSSVASVYGAAGSLVIILLWIYYSAQILFFGAEFTQVYANRFGSKVVPKENTVRLSEEARIAQGIPRKETIQAASAQGTSVEAVERKAVPQGVPHQKAEPDLLPQPQPSLLAFSALLAILVGFISGLVFKRGSGSEG